MKVTVNYYGQLRQLAGRASEAAEGGEGFTVQDCLAGLAGRYGEAFGGILFDEQGKLRPSVMVLVNGAAVDKDAPRALADGDQMNLIAAIAGG